MREKHSDLKERRSLVESQAEARHAEFEKRVNALGEERVKTLEVLDTELRAASRLAEIVAWHHNIRAAVIAAIRVTDVVLETLNKPFEWAKVPPAAEQGATPTKPKPPASGAK
jgi:hypothetical protein